MKRKIIISFSLSLLVFLLTSWTLAYSHYAASMVEGTCFYLLTYYILKWYARPNTFGCPYIYAIIAGRIILEIPLRITEFYDTIPSLFITLTVIISIILAAVYYKEKRDSVLVLTIAILILLMTICQHEWFEAFNKN